MDSLYNDVSLKVKNLLYQYMKDINISLLNYSFKIFFNHTVEINNIKVVEHHFTNKKIDGMTVIDNYGITISYEKTSPIVKRNFTLCHELGHYILNHGGFYFTESVDSQENWLEKEANIFSAVVLMPDIVLLSKIYYRCDNFYEVQNSLEVSKQALSFRLSNLFRKYYPNNDIEIKKAIESYKNGKNTSIKFLFHKIKEHIINEYNQYQPSLENKVKHEIRTTGFVTSQKIPELLKQEYWDSLKQNNINLKIWLIYNKGKSIAYVWDQNKLSEKEARKKAELQLLLI